ncbi:quinolinate synthase, chloroplastic [Silene latifolia]|uniref:quinolinate synthase, chloroplastic n=1 Tax=Silene latifolia TaxID=37657 RepID=UPI003D78A9BA
MSFTTRISGLPSSYCPCSCTNLYNFNNPPQKSNLFNLKPLNFQSLPLKVTNCVKNPIPKCESNSFSQVISYPDDEIPHISSSELVSLRLKRLVSEFRALSEPIDRVKRLLGYATVLPQLGESTRSPENRVRGCAAQVWLEVVKDEMGRMRFGADSDSEITKGFCSCLIFLLDGAYPQDILKVKAEDLTDMNVGLPVRSRVNSWHNVLVNMQERTKNFLEKEEDQQLCQNSDRLEKFPSLAVPADSIVNKGEVCVS